MYSEKKASGLENRGAYLQSVVLVTKDALLPSHLKALLHIYHSDVCNASYDKISK